MARPLPTIAPATPAAGRGPVRGDRWAIALILVCYLLAAIAVTWRLWADPASRVVAGNPNDTDLMAWFMRYDATAVTHARLPALVTAAMNAPQGINLMWNTSLLLPGVLLTPVTLLLGPQSSLSVLMTAGFAGSAASLFIVLRRWGVSLGSAALAGAVYGFSPALLQASIGHYNLQFAVLPPLIIDAGLRLCLRSQRCCPGGRPPGPPQPPARASTPSRLASLRGSAVRDGAVLGLLLTAQLFTGEELLLLTGLAGLLLVTVLALGQPRAVLTRWPAAVIGLAVATGVTLLLSGYALWVQFFGPLTQRGSSFTPDFFITDLTGFVTPSRYLLYHTAASAAAAARYQGGAPEYLAYLGWPLIALLTLAALAFCRQPAVRATAVTLAVFELLSLGSHPLIGGITHSGVTLPWHWLEAVPLLGTALPDRLPIIADGAAAALLAFALDRARQRLASVRGLPTLATMIAVIACLPLIPLPLPPAPTARLPAGWPAAFAALRLPPDARVLVVPVPTATLTNVLRWQADTGQPDSLIGGYFVGPAWNGLAYVEGNGVATTAQYLDRLWYAGPVTPGLDPEPGPVPGAAVPSPAQLASDLRSWRPAAVVAVTSLGSPLGHYLRRLFGLPAIRSGNVLAWRR